MHHTLHHFPWSFTVGLVGRVISYTYLSSTVSYPGGSLCLIDNPSLSFCLLLGAMVWLPYSYKTRVPSVHALKVTSALSQNKLLIYVSVFE